VTLGIGLEREHARAVDEEAQRVQAVIRAHVEDHRRRPWPAHEGFVQRVHLGIVTVEADGGQPRVGKVA
jgi:hypothetical protein